jgi:integrase
MEKWNRQLAHHGKTVKDAVIHFIHHLSSETQDRVSVESAALRWSNYVESDTKKLNRPRTIQEIRTVAVRFASLFPKTPLHSLSRKSIDAVISNLRTQQGKPVSPQTRRNTLTKLKQFLNWCVSQELLLSNPAQSLSVSVRSLVPEVYTLNEVHRLLEVVQHERHRCLVSYVTLGLFAGLRPTEAQRLTWNDFHWDHSVLSISPDRTKVKRARLVELHPVLLDWLKRVPRDQPLIPVGFSRRLKSYQRDLQIRWIPDGLRHSFATYWLGVHQNRNRLAELMGNSPSIIGRHYLKPVSRTEAQGFWLIHPTTF